MITDSWITCTPLVVHQSAVWDMFLDGINDLEHNGTESVVGSIIFFQHPPREILSLVGVQLEITNFTICEGHAPYEECV